MSFFRHREIFRSDGTRSVSRREFLGQIARSASNPKNFAHRTPYKRSASTPDTLGVPPENAPFARHKIFSREGAAHLPPLAHRLDELPAGYSSASCTPALLASASPAVCHGEPDSQNCQPPPLQGWGIFDRNFEEFSTGVDRNLGVAPEWHGPHPGHSAFRLVVTQAQAVPRARSR
jgi:hypothetical protein